MAGAGTVLSTSDSKKMSPEVAKKKAVTSWSPPVSAIQVDGVQFKLGKGDSVSDWNVMVKFLRGRVRASAGHRRGVLGSRSGSML